MDRNIGMWSYLTRADHNMQHKRPLHYQVYLYFCELYRAFSDRKRYTNSLYWWLLLFSPPCSSIGGVVYVIVFNSSATDDYYDYFSLINSVWVSSPVSLAVSVSCPDWLFHFVYHWNWWHSFVILKFDSTAQDFQPVSPDGRTVSRNTVGNLW